MTFARAVLLAVAALALGAYLASRAAEFADTACWLTDCCSVAAP